MINIHTVLIQTSIFSEGHRVDVNSSVQSTEQKAQDTDLTVVVPHSYSLLEMEIQAIFYSRISILYVIKEKRQGESCIGMLE